MPFLHAGQVFESLFQTLNLPIKVFGFSSAITLLAVLTKEWVTINKSTDMLANPNPIGLGSVIETFDFIVVGAGSAGAAVAYRLSENGNYKVLVLEAGGDPTPFNSIPAVATFALHLTNDWMYKTVPLKNCGLSIYDQEMQWARGKMLGGTSNLNFMIYTRGNPKDYESWANISNDEQWTYENVLPYFKKLEDYKGNWPDAKFHGTGGPVTISKQDYKPITSVWLEAGKELGYDTAHIDYNGYQIPGFFPMESTIKAGKRAGTYPAYLLATRKRPNVKVYPYSHVIKIELDENKRAVGVTYKRHGRTLHAAATKEIIVSGGAIGTPHLLLLSGIGPAADLQSLNITSQLDLPGVGSNLQDHVLVILGPFVFNDSISMIVERNVTLKEVLQYAADGSGPLGFNFVSATTLINTSFANGNGTWPDVQAFLTPIGVGKDVSENLAGLVGINTTIMNEYLDPYMGKDAAFVLVNVGRPKSSGTVKLESADPLKHPKLDPNYFDVDQDMSVMIEGLRFIINVFEGTKAFQKYNATFSPLNKLGPCAQHDKYSDAYFECYVRHLTMTTWHMCCSAKFGNETDSMAVLYSNLTVRGVDRLRVADASIMPHITNGNTNAPAIMIGEKASQLILEYWNNKNPQSEADKAPQGGLVSNLLKGLKKIL